MVYRIIISHKQTDSLWRFPKGAPTVAVFDAPTQDDLDSCRALGYHAVAMPQTGNRSANRNAGLRWLLGHRACAPDDIAEFLDGDRYPVQYKDPGALMARHGLDVLLYACSSDERMKKIYVPLEGATLVDTGTLCNPFYSCGFAMTMAAIQKVVASNGGYLFEPRFTGWGCEDQYLGLICSHLGMRVAITAEVTLNGGVGGDSGEHSGYRESLQQYVDLIREKKLEIRNEPRPFQYLR